MLPFYIALPIAVVLFALSLYSIGNYPVSGWAFIAVIVSGFAVLALICIILITGLCRHYGRIGCTSWGAQTGRPSKFVVTTRLDTGICLTLAPDGRWINRDAVIFNIPAGS